MDIQTLQVIFYSLGIVFMSTMLILMLFVVFAIFYIKAKVGMLQEQIEEKIEVLIDKPMRLATEVGTAIADKAAENIRKITKN